VIAISAQPKKRLRNAVARAGDEVIAISAQPKKRLRNAVARAGDEHVLMECVRMD
jgi:hypothetical protein